MLIRTSGRLRSLRNTPQRSIRQPLPPTLARRCLQRSLAGKPGERSGPVAKGGDGSCAIDARDGRYLGVNPADALQSQRGLDMFANYLISLTEMWKRRSQPTTPVPDVFEVPEASLLSPKPKTM